MVGPTGISHLALLRYYIYIYIYIYISFGYIYTLKNLTMCKAIDIFKLLDISLPSPSINDILNWSITPFNSFLY